jgi:hypothetical protein
VVDDPAVEADLRIILNRLADPGTAGSEKAVIRDMLHFLASRLPAAAEAVPALHQRSARQVSA